jgi:hypothetical protein
MLSTWASLSWKNTRVFELFRDWQDSSIKRMLGRIGMTIMFTAPLNSFMKFGYENGLDSEKDSYARGGQSTRQGNSRTPTDMLAKVNVQSESSDADDLSSFTKANTINLHGVVPKRAAPCVPSDGNRHTINSAYP